MYKKLFTPLKIGNVEIKNRLAVTAMVMNYNNADGTVTEQFIKYHEEKAKGGFGLIITEDYAISEHAKGYEYVAGLYRDDQIEGNIRLTDTIHKYGTKIFCQIYHPGRQTSHKVNGGVQPESVSPIACPVCREIPRELTKDEIQVIVKQFGETALRAKKSGFDGVEIHAGNGYLIAGFMSPYQNHRTDEYGGCFTNRMRLLTEVYHAVREQVGDDFPVTVRFSADEGVIGGRTLSESRVIAKYFEELGFDAINCSNGTYSSRILAQSADQYQPFGVTLENAREIKSIVNIPVLAVNRIRDALMADTYIDMGWCDLVGMSRTSLADPHFPNKAAAGQFESIRPCLGCKRCQTAIYNGQCECAVNPLLGREYLYDFSEKKKLSEPKNVVVIGGGPAGVTAALTAAECGHKVTLYEKNGALGGTFIAASYPPGKGELAHYVNWMNHEVKSSNIELHLNTEVTADMVQSWNADKVIVATGGHPFVPGFIKGVDRNNVVIAEDILLGKVNVEGNIVIAGGGEVGLETATYLAYCERGNITVVEMRPKIGMDMNASVRSSAMQIVRDRDIVLSPNTKILEFNEDGVAVESGDGVVKTIPADYIVLAMCYKPNDSLAKELSFLGDKLVVIGDSNERCSDVLRANKDGLVAGYNI